MTTKQYRPTSDPRLTSTQVSIRIPYHYREQLTQEALRREMTLPMLVVETMQRRFPVKAPTTHIDEAAE